jgi:hypothetical protein
MLLNELRWDFGMSDGALSQRDYSLSTYAGTATVNVSESETKFKKSELLP